MRDRPPTTLPEDLLLLLAHPRSGVLKPPRHLGRVLAGAVLTELMLTGAISVDDTRVLTVRKVRPADPFANRVLNRLLRTRKDARSMRLERWVHRASGDRIVQVYLDALAERGVVRRHTRSFLGLFASTTWRAADPGGRADLVARIDRAVRPKAHGAVPGPPDVRGPHLAALAGASRLNRRLDAEWRRLGIRAPLRDLTRATPIAEATRRVVRADRRRGGGGDWNPGEWTSPLSGNEGWSDGGGGGSDGSGGGGDGGGGGGD
ncbi:GOLPH3/VPS74 family protein [Streptomyces viridiviolaceus]